MKTVIVACLALLVAGCAAPVAENTAADCPPPSSLYINATGEWSATLTVDCGDYVVTHAVQSSGPGEVAA